MTQTPRRSGIRLPWSHEDEAERGEPERDVSTNGSVTVSEPDGPAVPGAASDATSAQPEAPTAAHGGAGSGTDDSLPTSDEDNALLASLVTAMREVADRERTASVTSLSTAVEQAIERLEARAAQGADELRQRAELDVAGIAEWVRVEIERIETEGRGKTDTRREQLTQQLAQHEERSRAEVDAMRARVATYEAQLASFFAQLNEISDPAAFGTAAKRMPRPPSLGLPRPAPAATEPAAPPPVAEAPEAPAGHADAPAEPAAAFAEPGSETSSEASTEASTEGRADTAADASAETAAETAGESVAGADVQAAAETISGEPGPESESEAEPDEPRETLRDRMDALGIPGEPAADPEPEAPAADAHGASDAAGERPMGLAERLAQLDARIGETPASEAVTATLASPATGGEVATAIMVSGLGSFGAITSFKQSLERVDGVHGISLSLGPTGEFVYRATHEAGFDLVSAIDQIERGTATIDRQADGSLRVAVQRGR